MPLKKLFKNMIYKYSKERIEKIGRIEKRIKQIETDMDFINYGFEIKVDPESKIVTGEYRYAFTGTTGIYKFSAPYEVIGNILYRGLKEYKEELQKEREKLL